MTKKKPEQLWFRRKKYGWGWFPSSWQGWLTILTYVVLVAWNFSRLDSESHSGSDTLINFIPQTLVLTAILIAVCFKKGERPKWQWGGK